MSRIWRSLLRDERGFVITAELILISTVLVLGLVVALNTVKTAIAGELGDVANAIGSLNQSYYTHGFHGCRTANGGVAARTYGSAFLDRADSSDEQEADFATGVNAVCTTAACIKTPCETPGGPCATSPPPCGTGCGTPCGSAPCGSAPCGSAPCGTAPCGTAPCGTGCGTPCGSAACGSIPVPCGSGCGSPCGQGYVKSGFGCGTSVPPVVCPPGPGPFTGTDPFAPGAVSPQNMLLQGISYGGVCAPPVAPQPPIDAPRPAPPAMPMSPAAPACWEASIPVPPAGPACCESMAAVLPQLSLPPAPAVVY
ncbi:MAG TPA: hypothetical protein VM510_16110 [Caulifigura sp.]|nr:hypothetical protein [Caulifigura sp.]